MRHFIMTQYKWLFLPVFFVLASCSDDDKKKSAKNAIGLYNVYDVGKDKHRFVWSCPEDKNKPVNSRVCEYRYEVNEVKSSSTFTIPEYRADITHVLVGHTLTDEEINAPLANTHETGKNGVFYLHVQYRVCTPPSSSNNCNESSVFTSEFKIQRATDPVVTITTPAGITSSNQSNYSVSGTCTVGDGNVSVSVGTVTGSSACSSSGAWSVTGLNVSSLADGSVTITASQTGSGGNTGSTTATVTKETVDTTRPVVTITTPAGITSSNQSNYSVSGTCTVGDGNVSVKIRGKFGRDGNVTLEVEGSSACSSSGAWSVTDLNVSNLSDGDIVITASQTDSEGNTGSATETVLKRVGTRNPSVAITSAANITSSNEVSYNVSGTCVAGAGSVVLTVSSGGRLLTTSGNMQCTRTGQWAHPTVDVTQFSWPRGELVLEATQTNARGQTHSARKTITKETDLDTTDPVVTITTPAGITSANQSSYSVSGTCTVGDGNVSVSVGTVTGSSACSSSGAWSVTGLNVSSLADGSVTITASQTDGAGNEGSATSTVTKSVSVPTITSPSNITSTNHQAYPVSGTCTAGSGNVLVEVSNSARTLIITGRPVCSASGSWTVTLNVSSLADANDIQIVASQGTGSNKRTSAVATVTKDATAPAVTIVADHINAQTPINYTIIGTCTSGQGDLSINFAGDITTLPCPSSGRWALAPNLANLSDGLLTITVSQTDSGGNTGSATKTINKDLVAPVVAIQNPTPLDDNNDESYSVSGTCTAGDSSVSVQIKKRSTSTGALTKTLSCSSSGAWSVSGWDVSALTNNNTDDIQIIATQTDSAGNQGRATATIVLSKIFITKWRIQKDSDNTDDNDLIVKLPLHSSGSYNFHINWGDTHCQADGHCTAGNENDTKTMATPTPVTSHNQAQASHKYNRSGTYTVTITRVSAESTALNNWHFGQFNNGDSNNDNDDATNSKVKLIEVVSLGDMGWANLSGAFEGCVNLTKFGGGETKGVTNMSKMFKGASKLVSLDISTFKTGTESETSAVTDMSGMFEGASALTQLNLSHFDTAAVTNMSKMFKGTSRLTRIVGLKRDQGKGKKVFNTAAVTNMSGMFEGASSLTALDLSDFNTGSVTNMSAMFKGASRLATLTLSTYTPNPDSTPLFNTSSVTDMSSMFEGTSALTTWEDIEYLRTASVTNMSSMFRGATKLKTLDLMSSNSPVNGAWNVGRVTSMNSMFFGCTALTSLDLDGWNLSNYDPSNSNNSNFNWSNIFYNVSASAKIICDRDADGSLDTDDTAGLGSLFGKSCSSE